MKEIFQNLVEMKWGVLFSLLTLIYGFGLGGVFGAFEDSIKEHLESKARAVFESVYQEDEERLKKITKKSWTYFKRAHLHANGLGTSALVLILLLATLPISFSFKIKPILAGAQGLGSLGYSLFWMLAGLKAPVLGSTDAAKEMLSWVAIPSTAFCIGGLIAISLLAVITFLKKSKI